MIKLKTFLDNRGYYETRWGYVRVFQKTIYNSNHDKLAQIFIKHDNIRISLFFPKELEKQYSIMWPQIKNYLKPFGMNDIRLHSGEIFLEKSASIDNNLSNKYANILSDFLDKWENVENLNKIQNDIRNIVNTLDSSGQGKTFNELIDFLKSKNFTISEDNAITNARQYISTKSYVYELSINNLSSETFTLRIVLYNSPYLNLLDSFTEGGKRYGKINGALWFISRAKPFDPFYCMGQVGGNINNYTLDITLSASFSS